MGLSYDETMTIPLSLLYDLIAVNQIKKEGYRYRQTVADGQAELVQMLKTLR